MRANSMIARVAGSYGPVAGWDPLLHHTDELAMLGTFPFEPDLTVFLCEQGMIATDADIHTRVKTSAALPNNNIAGNNFLAAVDFDAQAFAL